jgi:hypothetical protein
MITVSHPQVNQYVRALVAALDEKAQLQEFHTTLNIGRRNVGIRGGRQKIRQHPYREIVRLTAQRLGQEWLIRHGSGPASSDAVAVEFDRQVAKGLKSCSAIYCYEDSAFETFQAAVRLGIRRVYELPIVYWETAHRLLRTEAERYPNWEPTLQAIRDSAAKLERKGKELRLANLVICPSPRVQESLPAGTVSCVAEYGCVAPVAARRPRRHNANLRVLFAGTMTQRKGLADLFMA